MALWEKAVVPGSIRSARATAGAVEWRHRGQMMVRADVHRRAQDDFLSALGHDITDADSLDGFVRTAVVLGRAADALARLRELADAQPASARSARVFVALSKLQAASGAKDEALASARRAAEVASTDAAGLEQLASLHADAGIPCVSIRPLTD